MSIICTYDFAAQRLRYVRTREVYTLDQLNAEHDSKTKANKLITRLSGGRAFYESLPPGADEALGVIFMASELAYQYDDTVLICLPYTGWSAITGEVFE